MNGMSNRKDGDVDASTQDFVARTIVPVPANPQTVILEKVTAIEATLPRMVTLLEAVVAQLEQAAVPAQAPIASYETLYDLPEPGPPEGELVAAVLAQRVGPPTGWRAWLWTAKHGLLLVLVAGSLSGCAEYGYRMNELVGLNCRPEALQHGRCVATSQTTKRVSP